MRLMLPFFGLSLLGAGLWGRPSEEVTVIITGGARGHLSPCGCTKPMSGGLKRLATIVRDERSKGPVAWIDSGDIIETPGRQSQLKAETYAQVMGELGVDAAAYTTQDERQGLGLLVAGVSLSKKKWLTSAPEATPQTELTATARGLTVSAANNTSFQFGTERDSDILLFDGASASLTQSTKKHQIEVFSSDGIPTVDGTKMSPGSNLRGLIVAKFREGVFVSAKVVILEASIKDDPAAERVYDGYLRRLTEERLIDKVIRDTNDDYAGSQNCRSCHAKVYSDFLKTRHAHAYQSLVRERHQADPDCVSCHVTGLNSSKGFVFEKTPSLAQVGCESCHGPGRAHAQRPKEFRLPKVSKEKCVSCHSPSNSPNFNFEIYWKKIKH